MSRADKTLSKIVYEITLDESRSRIEKLVVTTLCAQKFGGVAVDAAQAFSTAPHIAFVATYSFSQQDQVEAFPIPREVGKLLK